MYNQKNYKNLMALLIFSIWVMYGLNWFFIMDKQFLIASSISIIMDISILLLLTLIVGVLNYIFQKEKEDKEYRNKKHKTDKEYRNKNHKTDKRKQLEKELRRSGFDPENLKDYLEE